MRWKRVYDLLLRYMISSLMTSKASPAEWMTVTANNFPKWSASQADTHSKRRWSTKIWYKQFFFPFNWRWPCKLADEIQWFSRMLHYIRGRLKASQMVTGTNEYSNQLCIFPNKYYYIVLPNLVQFQTQCWFGLLVITVFIIDKKMNMGYFHHELKYLYSAK